MALAFFTSHEHTYTYPVFGLTNSACRDCANSSGLESATRWVHKHLLFLSSWSFYLCGLDQTDYSMVPWENFYACLVQLLAHCVYVNPEMCLQNFSKIDSFCLPSLSKSFVSFLLYIYNMKGIVVCLILGICIAAASLDEQKDLYVMTGGTRYDAIPDVNSESSNGGKAHIWHHIGFCFHWRSSSCSVSHFCW